MDSYVRTPQGEFQLRTLLLMRSRGKVYICVFVRVLLILQVGCTPQGPVGHGGKSMSQVPYVELP